MFKKVLAVVLTAVLMLLAGCGNTGDSPNSSSGQGGDSSQKSSELQLLYCANDSLNPYQTISKLNAELAYLLFDPLVKVDNSFNEVKVLAGDISIQGAVCTVTLKDASFSDGSPLTADDVIYSYHLAKESELFSYLFYEVESVNATDSKTVVFTLNVNDPYFSKLLTFPVLKTGSDKLKDEDNVELVPIGTGRFIFDEENSALIPNPKYFGSSSAVSKIHLTNAPDNESMAHYVKVGATDIYYADLYDDTIIRMSGQKTSVNLNNLVYVGINHNNGLLHRAEMRYALSAAISREDIVSSAYYTNAVCATGFFHPEIKEVSGYQTIQSSSNEKISVENLAGLGYNILNEDGYYENSRGKIIEFSILVNSESSSKLATANLLKEQFKAVGIKLTVNAVNSKKYYDALKSGSFMLYLGEIKLLPNMDISSLVVPGKKAAYGIISDNTDDNNALNTATSYISVIEGFYSGENTASDVASSVLASMPVIPLIYRNSIVFYSNDIENIGTPSYNDIFLSIDEYKF